jgi:hypothetical protein
VDAVGDQDRPTGQLERVPVSITDDGEAAGDRGVDHDDSTRSPLAIGEGRVLEVLLDSSLVVGRTGMDSKLADLFRAHSEDLGCVPRGDHTTLKRGTHEQQDSGWLRGEGVELVTAQVGGHGLMPRSLAARLPRHPPTASA